MAQAVSAASSKLVDADLLGCPGISLGLVERRGLQATSNVTVYSVGCGSLPDRQFFAVLGSHAIQEVWDVRHHGVLAQCPQTWSPGDTLRSKFAAHGIRYRRAPLGRREAGGVRFHLETEEGKDTLARIIQASVATKGRVAMLGASEDWRHCERQAVAHELSAGKYGEVTVLHLKSCGSVEMHPKSMSLPAWLGPPPKNDTLLEQPAGMVASCEASGYSSAAPTADATKASYPQKRDGRRW
eukprot:TRINITY_DN30369_c0_g1_i4.p1 TRINITY_DN30369_c0_g1~~TRINITY_DN30369_c0_g1_i4.p1  ORF type:complete len:241 (+),score=30.96 TRINITY_DN30369_c0_g1_i4:228-950(+)